MQGAVGVGAQFADLLGDEIDQAIDVGHGSATIPEPRGQRAGRGRTVRGQLVYAPAATPLAAGPFAPGTRVTITAPDGSAWRIDVPSTGVRPRRILELHDGAVATSDTSARTWTVSGVRHRHVLDPHTGLPLERDLRATVVAGAGWWAEAAATAAIISTARGDRWVDSLGTIDGISDVDVSEPVAADA